MAKNWIAGAIKHPGALHKQMHVPAGKKIGLAKLRAAAAHGSPLEKRRAEFAITLAHLRSAHHSTKGKP